MASGLEDRRTEDSERAYRYRKDDRSPTSKSHARERDIRERDRPGRRSRSPSRHGSYSSWRNQSEYGSLKDREREFRTRETQAHKFSSKARPGEENGSLQRPIGTASGLFNHTDYSEIKQGQNSRPMSKADDAEDRVTRQSLLADVPVAEPELRARVSDPKLKLKETLALFLNEASQQASLQLRKDAAKKALDRRVADYEKSRKMHDDFPSVAETQEAAKQRAQQEFEELDNELFRKRQGSISLIELVADCVFPKSTVTPAPVQPQISKEVEQTGRTYHARLETVEKILEETRTTIKTELASIRQCTNDSVSRVATLAADIEQLKMSGDGVDLKAKIDGLSLRLDSVHTELNVKNGHIEVALDDRAKQIENLLKTNRDGRSELDGLKSTVTSLNAKDKEVRNIVTKLQANLKDKDKAMGTIVDRKTSDIYTKIVALENFRSVATVASQKLETFDGRVKQIENSLLVTEKLETIDRRIKKLESDDSEDIIMKKELDAVDKRLQQLESGQEKVDIVRQSWAKVESLCHHTRQSLEEINKRLKAVEDDHSNEALTIEKLEKLDIRFKAFKDIQSNDERKRETIDGVTHDINGKLAVFKEKLLKIQDGLQDSLREEFRKTQDAGDEIFEKYLHELDGRIRAVQDSNFENRIAALEVERVERNQAAEEQQNVSGRLGHLESLHKSSSIHVTNELNRISSDCKKLTDDTKRMTSNRVPPQIAHDFSRISNELQNLKDGLQKASASFATIGPLVERVKNAEERVKVLVNDVEGLKVGYSNLDFRMCNLSTAELARHILHQLDAHRNDSESNITALSLRVQDFDKLVNKNEEEKRLEVASIFKALRQELSQLVTSLIEEKVKPLERFNNSAGQVLDGSLNSLDTVQHEVDKSNVSLGLLREDVNTTKRTFTETKDRFGVEISKISNALTAAQKEITDAKMESKEGLAKLKSELEGFSDQLQMQAESRVPEKRKIGTNIAPKKANGHSPAAKKRRVLANRDRSSDVDSDFRPTAS